MAGDIAQREGPEFNPQYRGYWQVEYDVALREMILLHQAFYSCIEGESGSV